METTRFFPAEKGVDKIALGIKSDPMGYGNVKNGVNLGEVPYYLYVCECPPPILNTLPLFHHNTSYFVATFKRSYLQVCHVC